MGKPSEEPFLVSMGGEPSKGMNMSLYSNFLSKKPHTLRPIDNPPPNGPLSLIANEDDVGGFSPEVMFQMVFYPSRVAHPA